MAFLSFIWTSRKQIDSLTALILIVNTQVSLCSGASSLVPRMRLFWHLRMMTILCFCTPSSFVRSRQYKSYEKVLHWKKNKSVWLVTLTLRDMYAGWYSAGKRKRDEQIFNLRRVRAR